MAWSISKAMMKAYENSHSSLVPAAESSEESCLDGAQSAPSNTTPMPDQYYWPDKTTEHSRLSRFGMTCEPLMASLGEELLTWFLAGFPVKTSARQEKGLESTESEADYGVKWRASFARYDHDSSSWKTAQCLLLGGLESFSETWPQWGTMHNGACWEQDISGVLTSATGSGFWHPTPTKSDHKGANFRGDKQRESQLKEWLHVRYSQGMKTTYPHPTFLELAMAWPEGWTELSPLETAKFQRWLQQHGGF